jgi:hypothetical protein
MGQLVNAAIPFCVGVYVLLVGFRFIGKKPGVDPKFDQWHARFGIVMKVIGVVCILLSIFYLSIGSGRR